MSGSTMGEVSRREFAVAAAGGVTSILLGGACHAGSEDERIRARPSQGVATVASGTQLLQLDPTRDALLQMPTQPGGGPIPLLLLLHGAGGSGAGMLRRLGAFAADQGIAVLAPDSRGSTWDAIRSGFGPDTAFINRALDRVFAIVRADPERIAIGGFSDGATHALSLGLANGDLFRRIVAFSPGFYVASVARGRPRIFVSHGTADPVLPIDRCSRVIVPALKKQGYDITYRPFDGGHEIPPHLAREGLRFLL